MDLQHFHLETSIETRVQFLLKTHPGSNWVSSSSGAGNPMNLFKDAEKLEKNWPSQLEQVQRAGAIGRGRNIRCLIKCMYFLKSEDELRRTA
jgi:hypothetical protein